MVETASNALSILRVLCASFVKLVFIDPPKARHHLSLPGQPKVLYTSEYTMTEENKHWGRRKFWELSQPRWEPRLFVLWAWNMGSVSNRDVSTELSGKSCIPPCQESFLILSHSCDTTQTNVAIDTVLSEMELGTTHYQNNMFANFSIVFSFLCYFNIFYHLEFCVFVFVLNLMKKKTVRLFVYLIKTMRCPRPYSMYFTI